MSYNYGYFFCNVYNGKTKSIFEAKYDRFSSPILQSLTAWFIGITCCVTNGYKKRRLF